MAEEIQSNIRVDIDTSDALANIKALQREISAFHTQMSKAGSANAAQAASMQNNLINSINQSGKFAASFATVQTSAQAFTTALEKNKFSIGQYFKYAAASSKSFSTKFAQEFATVNNVAIERVKDLQAQYIKLGRDANGAIRTIKVRPLTLDMENLATKTAIAAQKQQILNQLLDQGSTKLLNFGKNMQWAGRQLMVGFTIPLSMFATSAIRAFSDIEKQRVTLTRVYGDITTTKAEADAAAKSVQNLASKYTQYGIAVADTMKLGTTAAQAGAKGKDLVSQVAAASNLAVLGGIDQEQSFKTIMVLKNTFGLAGKELSNTVNLMNAANNQTVLNIEDLTTAIPKAGPVVKQLGGNMKDLVFFMTAMREGGISASEGANALKSALSSMINPTTKAQNMLKGMGIDLRGIVQKDKGNLRATVMDFANALDKLDPLKRAQALETLFGKFQFARVSALFNNITKAGSQAQTAAGLGEQSPLELQKLADRELKKISQSPLFQFQKQVADFQAAIAPIGESLMKFLTPIMKFFTDMAKGFSNLPDGMKTAIVGITVVLGGLAPLLLMLTGLVANGAANTLKFFTTIKKFFNNLGTGSKTLGEQIKYLNQEEIDAAAQAASLDQVHQKLKQTFTSEAEAVDLLTNAYRRAIDAQRAFTMPGTPGKKAPARKMATGGIVSGPGTGTSDSVPAMLSNGEAVIPAKAVQENPGIIAGLITGSIPHYAKSNVKVSSGSINVGGSDIPISASEAVVNKIQQYVAAIEKGRTEFSKETINIKESEEVLARTFEILSQETKVSVRDFLKRLAVSAETITGQGLGNQINSFDRNVNNAQYDTIRFSAKGVGTIPSQLEAAGRTDELQRAQMRLEAEKSLGFAGQHQIDRAHKYEVGSSGKLFKEAWHESGWNPGTNSENAISNALHGDNATKGFAEKYQKQMDALLKEGIMSQEEYDSILAKINENAALSESELLTQAEVLKRIVAEEQEFLSKYKSLNQFVQRAIAGASVPGALLPGAGEQNPAQRAVFTSNLSAAKGLGTPVVTNPAPVAAAAKKVVQQEIQVIESTMIETLKEVGQVASPAKAVIEVATNYGKGFLVGAEYALPDVKAAAQTMIKEAFTITPASLQYAREQLASILKPLANGQGIIDARRALQLVDEDLINNAKILTENDLALRRGTEFMKVARMPAEAFYAVIDKIGVGMDLVSVETLQAMNRLEEGATKVVTVIEEKAAEAMAVAQSVGGKISSKVSGAAGKVKAGVTKFVTKDYDAAGAANKVAGFANKISGASMAVMMLSSAMSMIPGPIGKFVEGLQPVIMGLSTVGMLLPLFSEGLLTAIIALMPEILLAAAAVAILVAAFMWMASESDKAAKKQAAAAEKTYQSTMGLANAISGVTDVTGFNAAFGTNLANSPLATYQDTGSNTTQAHNSNAVTSKIEELKGNKDFLKANKNTIDALKAASSETAGIALDTMAQNLLAKGAAKDDVTAFITALKDEAGKTDVSLDFKTLEVGSKKGVKSIVKNINTLNSDAIAKIGKVSDFDYYGTGQQREKGWGAQNLLNLQSTNNDYRSLKSAFKKDQVFKNVDELNPEQKAAYDRYKDAGLVETNTTDAGKKQFKLTDTAKTNYQANEAFIGSGSNKAALTAMETAASTTATTMDTLSSALKNGKINSDQFEYAMKNIEGTFLKIEKVNPGQSIVLMNALLSKLPSAAQKTIHSVHGVSAQFKLAKAAMLGLSIVGPAAAIKAGQAAKAEIAKIDTYDRAALAKIKRLQAIVKAGDDASKQLDKDIKAAEKLADAVGGGGSSTTQTAAEKRQAKYEKRSAIISDAEQLLGKYAEKVNKEYQARIDALQKVADLNKQITQAQQDQLGLAQALSKGDIAAAAQAAQAYSQNQQAAELDRQKKSLDQQQQDAVAALTVKVGGKNYTMQQLQDIQTNLDINNLTANLKGKKINFSTGGVMPPSYLSEGGTSIAMIPKGTDIVPAMLTPGEFVVSAPAVSRFGVDNLRSINSGQTSAASGDSVYNYNVSVNVSSMSDPNEIAGVVMNKIRQVDSQRIRGVRV